jgi:hypothetical protein
MERLLLALCVAFILVQMYWVWVEAMKEKLNLAHS